MKAVPRDWGFRLQGAVLLIIALILLWVCSLIAQITGALLDLAKYG